MTSNLKISDLRIRKATGNELPFFRHHSEFVRTNCFIIDLEIQNDENVKVPTEETDRVSAYKKKFAKPVSEDEPMEGLEMVGEPLEVSMLSESCMNSNQVQSTLYKGYHSGMANEASSLDINALSVQDALYFFHNFEFSDTIKSQLFAAMAFTDKLPKTYSLLFFANADNHQERTAGLTLRFVDSLKHSGLLNHYGAFNSGIRSFVNFKLLAYSVDSTIRSINCQSCYNALCNSHIIDQLPKWPKFALQDVSLTYDDETDEPVVEDDSTVEFIPGVFSIRTNWTENAASKQTALEQMTNDKFPVSYFEKPGGLFDTVVTVKPGWLDNRVKGFERSVHLRFLMHLCDCLDRQQIVWPSKREQPELLKAFKNYVANLSAVESTKQSYDFIEGLWDYLCCCRSLASVRAILKMTYDFYLNGILNSKYVRVDNTSQTALILKTVDISNAFIPRLDEWTCVESIIQVGADRLRRDLMNELIIKKRFPQSSFSESLKITPRAPALERINIILKMHLVLQSVNLISEHVSVQLAEMQKVFNMLLSQYSKFSMKDPISKAMLNEEFSFDTKVCNIESFVMEISRLREWSVTYEFSDKNSVRSSYTVHLTRFSEFKNLAPDQFSQRFVANNGDVSLTDHMYWDNFECCTYSESQKRSLGN